MCKGSGVHGQIKQNKTKKNKAKLTNKATDHPNKILKSNKNFKWNLRKVRNVS